MNKPQKKHDKLKNSTIKNHTHGEKSKMAHHGGESRSGFRGDGRELRREERDFRRGSPSISVGVGGGYGDYGGYGYGYGGGGYSAGIIIAIVIIVITIIVVIWVIGAGINAANEVDANGNKQGFPAASIAGIVIGVVILIITVIIVIWLIRVAGSAARAVTGY